MFFLFVLYWQLDTVAEIIKHIFNEYYYIYFIRGVFYLIYSMFHSYSTLCKRYICGLFRHGKTISNSNSIRMLSKANAIRLFLIACFRYIFAHIDKTSSFSSPHNNQVAAKQWNGMHKINLMNKSM